MRIAEVARRLKVSRDWIRRLDRDGVIAKPTRDINGHRRYSDEDLTRLRSLLFPSEDREGGA